MRVIKVGSTQLKGHTVKQPINLSASAKVKLAEKYKQNPTRSEKLLIELLEAAGYSFEFQPLMHGYIPDFYFPSRKYIVELDGMYHKPEEDALRDAAFLKKGIRTLRIRSSKMFSEPATVLAEIVATTGIKVKVKLRPKRTKRKHKREWRPDALLSQFHHATEGL